MLTNELGPDVFKIHVKGQCLGKRIKFTVPVNSVLRPYTMDQGPVFPKSITFSGTKSNIQIEIKRIRARVLASKILHLFH